MLPCLVDHKPQMREINFNYPVCTVQLFLFCFALIEHGVSYSADELNTSSISKRGHGVHFNVLM